MFTILEEGSSVSLVYVRREGVTYPSVDALREIRTKINALASIRFEVTAEPWNWPGSPYLNLYVFCNKSNYSFQWTVSDATERSKLISALNILKSELETIGYISKDEMNTGQILQSILEERTRTPLISIGNRTYKVALAAASEPFSLEDNLRSSIDSAFQEKETEMRNSIAVMKARFDAELAAANDTNRRPYPLTARDFFDGWRTWIRDGYPVLGKQFTFAPKYITDGRNTYKIKPEVTKKWTCKGIAAYVNNGYAFTYEHNGHILKTHHTRDGGYLCTGDLRVPSKLEYNEAKSFVLQLIEMLNVIYIYSTTSYSVGRGDPYHLDNGNFKEYCEPVAVETISNPNRNSRNDPETITRVVSQEAANATITDGEML